MKDLKVMYMKNTDNWKTPTELYNAFMKAGCIDTFKYESKLNELENNYYSKKLFINPPFSKMKEVTKWIQKQYLNNNRIYLLIPARTDTKYFHDLLKLHPFIIFIKGRLHYNDSKSAPFPTVLLIIENSILNLPLYQQMTQEELKEKIKTW